MSENQGGFGSGILRGLKNILFTQEAVNTPTAPPAPAEQNQPPAAPPTVAEKPSVAPVVLPPSSEESIAEMKLKVYQLLESMNKPGCDFFEVWNAATEMGGANAGNIKAAYTSLKFADKSLTKAKLIETGEFYISNLKNVLASETKQKQDEKARLDKEKEQSKATLVADIDSLEKQIAGLQDKLAAKILERDNIDNKYEPRIAEIDGRISTGLHSVNSVVNEMTDVLAIVKTELST